ncbi:hypothetical protein PIB30_030957 [Stylosanthes scabra]|uniref:Uncharacterized protein n=1 Tax=Stylosanthes scabra TaxID=79078 RepID=A0ABU6SBW1_9FABA|nr:hypothetical protein [Stylosanthes scabra]
MISEENQYELVPPNSEERVCYYNLLHPEERYFIYMYECLFSKLDVRVSFTQFEQDILYKCRVASSQLHPNSWGFMKAFQTVYWYLHLDLSLRAFLYFFHLTQPFSSRKKSQWSSFRAREESPKFDFDDLDETDKEIVTVLSQCCARIPFNTKVRRIIRRVLPAPSIKHRLPDPRTSLFPQGPRLADQSKSKKRKCFGHSYESVYATDFDAVGFTDEFIMENSQIAMDEAGLKSNLEFMMKASIKVAGISRALQKKLIECPPTSRADLEQLKEKVAALEKGKEDAEGELPEARADANQATELRKKVESLEVDLAKQKEEYEELEDGSIKSNDNIVENLRLQAKILVPTLEVHFLHPDNYVAGDRIVWCSDLLPVSGGPFFEEEAAEVGDTEKSELQTGADDAEKAPPV